VLCGQFVELPSGVDRRVHPDVEDPGGDGGLRRCRQQVADGTEQVAADVGDPQRAVAEGLELGGSIGRLGLIAVAEGSTPDAGAGQHVAT
jgi:hypothetical protein